MKLEAGPLTHLTLGKYILTRNTLASLLSLRDRKRSRFCLLSTASSPCVWLDRKTCLIGEKEGADKDRGISYLDLCDECL